VNQQKITRSSARFVVATAATLAIVFGASSCGGGGSNLSEQAQRGQNTAKSNGCASCHGANGQGGVGPPWIDLAGAQVELKDGTSVLADDAYLLRSILDPGAEEVAGYTLKMAPNGLSDADAADVVAYIKELTTTDPTE
jgi:mono/diheme cytochrome c family protein